MNTTQLISAHSYDTSKMIFSDPIEGAIPDSTIKYRRINISTKNNDGSIGELVIPTERIYSYGLSENLNQTTGKVDGYSLPLVLYNKNGASEEEKHFVETFNNIVNTCKKFLLDEKDTLELYDLEANDLKKLNPIYYKRDKGKIVEGSPPTLYAKLIVKKDKKEGNTIISKFFDEESGDEMNPLNVMGKSCYTSAVIKFESIFIGNKISLQVKLTEADVKPIETGFKRLLPSIRPKAVSQIISSSSNNIPLQLHEDNEDDDDGSLVGDDDKKDDDFPLEEEEVKQEAPKKIIKKVIKKVTK